ncbi:hypothetical protein [Brevundimonas sp. PAMC22021]|uniref:hypothetical protein n=1 Tax=Brevundimonas sp. PAMC22021 TaxID=2861285 RepID=UPI001C63A422|nr:hypothetical protein [Brevundimonas sp. PAMC22021]QYF87905.1 hypothetical protein KY493_05320 [Brevundimonas sp. PAMC22021]
MGGERAGRGERLLRRVRQARHPLHGWRRWAVIAGQALAGLIALFAVVNLTLSLTTFRGEDPLARTVHELRVLWFSPPDGRPMSPQAFPAVYGRDLGPEPTTDAIRAYFEREADDGVVLLSHVMTDRILAMNGRIDGRAIPPGVYIGVHALGPDGSPLVQVTKYLAHYLLFPRHAYILVVPQDGPAISFSASQNAKFGVDLDPYLLAAEVAPFTPDAYDFPSSGEALHEMTRITDDPGRIAGAVATLQGSRARIEAERRRYGLLAPNSNTAVGCVLQSAGAITQAQRSSILLALRAPGFGASCG